ncbi:MAG: HAMP domain-containing histidine kinase [Saprospiraceae bacterium]|jgi:signal transduction histidine kinase|nr:HAMP domain-containing histidine kinase [Saprospiraceae bacterium]
MAKSNIWKNRRLRHIIILVAGSIVALWIMIVVLFYNFTVSQYETSTLMRLSGIANSLALQIDGDIHQQIFYAHKAKDEITNNNQDSLYRSLHELLKSNHEANMLKSPVYTITMDSSGMFYEFGITSDSVPYYRHPYNTYHATLKDHYISGGMIPAYKDEFGMWLSAFSPVKNSKNKTVAVVMVDEKLDIFQNSVRSELLKAFLLSLAIFLTLISILIWQMRKILSREQKDKNIIEEANSKITRMNKELSVANNKLSNLDQFRKEMISNISHDLRTPMAGIIGFLELIKNSQPSLNDEEKNKYIDIAYSETIRLNHLVSDLFEITKLESGQLKINKEPFNIYELVSDIIQKYQLRIRAKHVELNFEIEENQGLAYGDIKYIDRVFQNLLDNAVRYVDEGGYIKIWILDAGDKFKVKICNSGDLIPKEDLDIIFERYYTNEKSDNARSGLGLAIAKSICTLHGCTIKAEINNSVNSFWFTVPKAGL